VTPVSSKHPGPGRMVCAAVGLALESGMARFLVCLVLSVLVAQAVCACRAIQYDDPNDLLPEDWPVNQLSVPRDVELTQLPVALHAENPEMVTREWVVVFNYQGNWPGLVQHVESCLKTIDYFRQRVTRSPAGFEKVEMQTYYSPDFLTEVVISNGKGVPGIEASADAEFALWVVERQAPNRVIQSALDVRQQRPEMGETLLDGMIELID